MRNGVYEKLVVDTMWWEPEGHTWTPDELAILERRWESQWVLATNVREEADIQRPDFVFTREWLARSIWNHVKPRGELTWRPLGVRKWSEREKECILDTARWFDIQLNDAAKKYWNEAMRVDNDLPQIADETYARLAPKAWGGKAVGGAVVPLTVSGLPSSEGSRMRGSFSERAIFVNAVERFAVHIEIDRGLSPTTCKAYLRDLADFQQYMLEHHLDAIGEKFHLEAVTLAHLRSYIEFLRKERNCGAKTVCRQISTLRVFFAFCVETERLEKSPAYGLRKPKVPHRLPVYLSVEEAQSLLAACDGKDFASVRDYAILSMMLYAGLRRQELVMLNVDALNFSNLTIRVIGKGNKERLIPMSSRVEEALKRYLPWFEGETSTGAVFRAVNGGQRLTGRAIGNIVKHCVEKAKLSGRGISPHKLRHTFATMLHGCDVDIVEIKDLLGHSSLSSTQVYTHTNSERLRSAIKKLAP